MNQRTTKNALCLFALVTTSVVLVQCGTTNVTQAQRDAGADAFALVYEVLQHPRCKNCHPVDRVPLQGDTGLPHGQNVHGGDDGKGRVAMRCATCHHEANNSDPHQPPGAPNWHLPPSSMPMVFVGRTPAQLARQLADPQQNGGKSPAEILHHVAHDPLVLWGWAPGPGRAPVSVPHAEFVAAMRAWVDAGCPEPR